MLTEDLGAENRILKQTLEALQDCSDITHRHVPNPDVHFVYFSHLVSQELIQKEVFEPFGNIDKHNPSFIQERLDQSQYNPVNDLEELLKGVLAGNVAIFYQCNAYLVNIYSPENRSIQPSESEGTIAGPDDSFTESINTNLSLIRKRIQSTDLKAVSFQIGRRTKSTLTLLYLKDIADQEHVRLLSEKIRSVDAETIFETNTLIQFITSHPFSLFPVFLTSKRPDVICSKLTSGKVVGLIDGSPVAFSTPAAFLEFFSSPDDYYLPWMIGTFIRLLRFIGLLITVGSTALYVSIVTYHYEMIPPELLYNLMESRTKVPFTPLFEALLMEITLELLREAGARLPTKIGQTIGIVGGIVIGQAAVQAGITSNILIIVVAVSAISSYAIPNYIMSLSIRLARFGVIIMTGMFGNFGFVFSIAFLIIQLAGLESFGSSYLYPIAPIQPNRWMDMIARGPYQLIRKIRKRGT